MSLTYMRYRPRTKKARSLKHMHATSVMTLSQILLKSYPAATRCWERIMISPKTFFLGSLVALAMGAGVGLSITDTGTPPQAIPQVTGPDRFGVICYSFRSHTISCVHVPAAASAPKP